MPPASSPPPSNADEGEVFGPLADYALFTLRAPLRHRRLAAAIAAGCLAVGVVAALTLPRKYQVEAVVLAQRNPLMGALSNPGMNRDWDAPTRAAKEIVIRRDNLVALCRGTDLPARYLATRAPAVRLRDWLYTQVLRRSRAPAQLEDDLVSGLQDRLQVWVSPEGAVTLSFTWSDPDIALDVVEAALQSFLEARNLSEMGAVGDAIAILQGHDTRVQKEIADAIRRLEEKEASLRIRTAPRRTAHARTSPKADDELQRLQGLLTSRRRALADVEEFRQRRLSELQVQLAQQLSVYGPEHPNVLGTRQAIAGLKVPSPQVAELKGEIAGLEKQIEKRPGGAVELPAPATTSMEEDLAAARAALLDQTDPRLDYERRLLETLLRRHASLLERIESARIELDTARSAFQQRYTIITPPKRPKGPLKPYGVIYVVGSLVAGALLACGGAAARDLWAGHVIEPWQVERALGVPLLGGRRR
jgi:uncharacterized protein involved in exopolysaccharide biosynthesis